MSVARRRSTKKYILSTLLSFLAVLLLMADAQKASADTIRYTWDVYESYTAYDSYWGYTGTETYISGYNRVRVLDFISCYWTTDVHTGKPLEICDEFYTWIDEPIYSTRDTYGWIPYSYTDWRDTGNDVSSLDPNAYPTNNVYRNKRSTVENYSPVLAAVSDSINHKNDLIDLTIEATDVEDGIPSIYNAISSDSTVVEVVSVDGNKVQLKALQVGTSAITVSTTDSYGETTSQVFEVTVLNTKANVDYVIVPKIVVVDDSTNPIFKGRVSDVDGDLMEVRLTVANGAIFTSLPTMDDFEITLLGRILTKGYYFDRALVFDVYDGTEYSFEEIVNVPLVKVDNAPDYLRVLKGHSNDYEDWSNAQHYLFYKIYEDVLTYERERNASHLEVLRSDIELFKSITGLETSHTLMEWQNRIDLVEATVATEKAENSLLKDDYLPAQTLVENFVLSNVQEQFIDDIADLTSRIADLERYHSALDSILHLESSPQDINWNTIFDVQNKINVVQNPTNKTALNNRLQILKNNLMSNLDTVTITDLINYGVDNVVLDQELWYQEYFSAFQPLGEGNHAQELVDFTNELINALANLSRSELDSLIAKVPSYASEDVEPTIDALEEILSYRILFKRTSENDSALESSLSNVPFAHTLEYMEFMKESMYETIEYNESHDINEKQEGTYAIMPLWDGTFKNEMQAYIDNDLPSIIVSDGNKEYINNGTFNVVGTIQDDNDTEHTVTVKFNGIEKTITTTDKAFNVSFDGLSNNVFDDRVNIEVKDPYTTVRTTLTDKPVITTSDISLYNQYAEAIENDLDLPIQSIQTTTLTNLLDLVDKVKMVDIHSSERFIRDVENLAVSIGGKDSQVESITKTIISNVRLEWLIDNYITATPEDFNWAGVVGVTSENIDDLKQIITDYIQSFEDGEIVPMPTITDYQEWLTYSELVVQTTNDIESAKQITAPSELRIAIQTATDSFNQIPEWLSAYQSLLTELNSVKDFYETLYQEYSAAEKAVVKAEESLRQVHKDEAQAKVDALQDSSDKELLQVRLDALQILIDNKEPDLMDKLLSDPSTITPQELADYTGKMVYQELMPKYLDEMLAIGNDITKAQVMEIVGLITKFEKAKRSMNQADIKSYEDEFTKASVQITVTELPAPTVLNAISEYLENDQALNDVIKELAIVLNTTEETIRNQIQEILQSIERDNPTEDNTLSKESSIVKNSSMLIASLDSVPMMKTMTVAAVEENVSLEDQAQYLYKAFYALASVKAYIGNPNEAYRNEVSSYIHDNLYDGEFKGMLLSGLDFTQSETARYTKIDLTAVYPTGTSGGGDIPSIPSITDTISSITSENGVKWIIKNPTKNNYLLTSEHVEIVLPFNENAKELVIEWLHLGNEQYQLNVYVDSKNINDFKTPINIKVKHDFAYLLELLDDQTYAPVSYGYSNDIFHFTTSKTGQYYFSTKKVTFNDIEGVFSKEAIESLASRHIVSGTGNGKYSPYSNLTRAQFATMLVHGLGLEAKGENPFTDTKGQWHEKYVLALYEAGITAGTSETTFSPNSYITRQQAATMLYKVFEILQINVPQSESTFADNNQILDYAKNAVGTLQALNIVSGKEENIYDPTGYLSRAQFAVMLTKTLKYAGKY